jgi:hypothetical protein
MRQNADAGTPLGNFSINDDITTSIEQLASELAAQVIAQDTGVGQPTISMS